MITLDQCLNHLVALIERDEDRPFPQARGYIDAFVPLVSADRIEGARLLLDLKGQLSRRTHPSPLQLDIIDLIDARIVRLSDNDDHLDF